MKLPKLTLRGALHRREVQLPNPLKIDPILVDLLEKLDGVSTKEGYNRWKTDFLNRFQQVLGDEAIIGDDQNQQQNDNNNHDDAYSPWMYVCISYDTFRKTLDKFAQAVNKVNRHTNAGTLTHSKVSVKARNSLAEVVKQAQGVDNELKGLAPRYPSEEKLCGYNRYHLGHIMVDDNFAEFDRLNKNLNMLRLLRQKIVNDVADKYILAQLDEFDRSVGRFHSTMIVGLGLDGVLWKSRMLNPAQSALLSTAATAQQQQIPELRQEPTSTKLGNRSVTSKGTRTSKSNSRKSRDTRSSTTPELSDGGGGGGGGGGGRTRIKSPRRDGSSSPKRERALASNSRRDKERPGGRRPQPPPFLGGGDNVDGSRSIQDGSVYTTGTNTTKGSTATGRDTAAATGDSKIAVRRIRRGVGEDPPDSSTGGGRRDSPDKGATSRKRSSVIKNSNPKRVSPNPASENKKILKKADSDVSIDSIDDSSQPQQTQQSMTSIEDKNTRDRSILDNIKKMSSQQKTGAATTTTTTSSIPTNDLSEARKLFQSLGETGNNNSFLASVTNTIQSNDNSGAGGGPKVSFADIGSDNSSGHAAAAPRARPTGFTKKDGFTTAGKNGNNSTTNNNNNNNNGLVKLEPKKPRRLKKKATWIKSNDDDDDKSVVSIASKNKAKKKQLSAAKGKHNMKKINPLRTKKEGLKNPNKKASSKGATTTTTAPAKTTAQASNDDNDNNASDIRSIEPSRSSSPNNSGAESDFSIGTEDTDTNDNNNLSKGGEPLSTSRKTSKGPDGAVAKTSLRKKSRSVQRGSRQGDAPVGKHKVRTSSTKQRQLGSLPESAPAGGRPRPVPQRQSSKLTIQWPPPKPSDKEESTGGSSSNSNTKGGKSRGRTSERGKEMKKLIPRGSSKDKSRQQRKEDPPASRRDRHSNKSMSPTKTKKKAWPSLLGAPDEEEDESDNVSLSFDMNLIPGVPFNIPTPSFTTVPNEESEQPPLKEAEESEQPPLKEAEDTDNVYGSKSKLEVEYAIEPAQESEEGSNDSTEGGDETQPIAERDEIVGSEKGSLDKNHQAHKVATAAATEPPSSDQELAEKGASLSDHEPNETPPSLSEHKPSEKPISEKSPKPAQQAKKWISPLTSPRKRLTDSKLYPWDIRENAASKTPQGSNEKTKRGAQLPSAPPLESPSVSRKVGDNFSPKVQAGSPRKTLTSPLVSPRKRLTDNKLYPWDIPDKASPQKTPRTQEKPKVKPQLPNNVPIDLPSSTDDPARVDNLTVVEQPSPTEQSSNVLKNNNLQKTKAFSPAADKSPLSSPYSQKLPQLSPMAQGKLGVVDRNRVSQQGTFEPLKIDLMEDGSEADREEHPWKKSGSDSRRKTTQNVQEASSTVQAMQDKDVAASAPAEPTSANTTTDATPNTENAKPASLQGLFSPFKAKLEDAKETLFKPRTKLATSKFNPWNAPEKSTPEPLQSPPRNKLSDKKVYSWMKTAENNAPMSSPKTLRKAKLGSPSTQNVAQEKRIYDKTRDELKKLADSIQIPAPVQQKKMVETDATKDELKRLADSIQLPASVQQKKIVDTESNRLRDISTSAGITRNQKADKKLYPWDKPDVPAEPQRSETILDSKPKPAVTASVDQRDVSTSLGVTRNPKPEKKLYPWDKAEVSAEQQPSKSSMTAAPDSEQHKEPLVSESSDRRDVSTSVGDPKAEEKLHPWDKPDLLDEQKSVESNREQPQASVEMSNEDSLRASLFSAGSTGPQIFEDNPGSGHLRIKDNAPATELKFKPVSNWSKPSVDDDELSHPIKKPKEKKVRSAVSVKKTGKPKSGRMKPQHADDDSSVVKMKKTKKKGEVAFTKKAASRVGRREPKPWGNPLDQEGISKPWGRNPLDQGPAKPWGRNPLE